MRRGPSGAPSATANETVLLERQPGGIGISRRLVITRSEAATMPATVRALVRPSLLIDHLGDSLFGARQLLIGLGLVDLALFDLLSAIGRAHA